MKIKVLFFAICAFILTGCSSSIRYSESVDYVDYNEYLNEGIFITESNSVNFAHTPLGSISVEIIDGFKKGVRNSKFKYADMNGQQHNTEEFEYWSTGSYSHALRLAIEEVKKKGGNGLINLNISVSTQLIDKEYRTVYSLTGMAINKK